MQDQSKVKRGEWKKKKKQWKMQSNLPRVLVVQLHLTALLRSRKLQFRVPNLRSNSYFFVIDCKWTVTQTRTNMVKEKDTKANTVWQSKREDYLCSSLSHCVSLCISLLDTSCIQCASLETSWLRWKDGGQPTQSTETCWDSRARSLNKYCATLTSFSFSFSLSVCHMWLAVANEVDTVTCTHTQTRWKH